MLPFLRLARCTTFMALVVILVIGMISCGKKSGVKQAGDIVAGIDHVKITRADLEAQLRRYINEANYSVIPDSIKRMALNDMINQQILLLESLRLGYDKEPRFISLTAEKERELAGKELRVREIDNFVLSDSVLHQFYDWNDRDIYFYRIKCKISSSDKQAALKKANMLYEKLLKGANFQALAADYSEHVSAKKDSGNMLLSSCFNTEEPIFREVYKLAEGQTSAPILLDDAYFIFKVKKIQHNIRKSFAEERTHLAEHVYEIYQEKLMDRTREFNNALLAEFHFALDQQAIDFFCQRAQAIKTRADSAGLFTLEECKTVLCRNDVQVITLSDFFTLAFPYYYSSLYQKKLVSALLTDMNVNRLVKHKGMLAHLNELPSVRDALDDWKIYYLKFQVVQRQIIEKIAVPEDTLRAIYESQRGQFVQTAVATVREIFCIKETDILPVRRLAMAGQNFAGLQKKYSQDRENRNNGIVGPFDKGQNGALGDSAFVLQPGQISKPFRYHGGFSIIQLLSREPAKAKSFDQSKVELKEQYLNQNRDRLTDEWTSRAKGSYTVFIDL